MNIVKEMDNLFNEIKGNWKNIDDETYNQLCPWNNERVNAFITLAMRRLFIRPLTNKAKKSLKEVDNYIMRHVDQVIVDPSFKTNHAYQCWIDTIYVPSPHRFMRQEHLMSIMLHNLIHRTIRYSERLGNRMKRLEKGFSDDMIRLNHVKYRDEVVASVGQYILSKRFGLLDDELAEFIKYEINFALNFDQDRELAFKLIKEEVMLAISALDSDEYVFNTFEDAKKLRKKIS